MGTYGYISIIAMVCYGFMLLMFLTAKRNKIVNSFLVVLVGLLFWAGGSAFMRVHLWPSYEFWYQVSLLGILLLGYSWDARMWWKRMGFLLLCMRLNLLY